MSLSGRTAIAVGHATTRLVPMIFGSNRVATVRLFSSADDVHAVRLRTLRPLSHLELHPLTLVQ